MHTTNQPEQFITSLKKDANCVFDNGVLKAEITRVQPKNSKREYILKYFKRVGALWVSFGFVASPFMSDLRADFTETYRLYSC